MKIGTNQVRHINNEQTSHSKTISEIMSTKQYIAKKRVYLNCLALSETGLPFIEILHPRGPLLTPSPFSVPKTEAANSQPELIFT